MKKTPDDRIYLFRFGRKIYSKNLKFCIAAVFVVCQRDNHILEYGKKDDEREARRAETISRQTVKPLVLQRMSPPPRQEKKNANCF